ncbi:hypothetical protein THASP1DRAFT_23388 [Thamnocephalis sphaerospora]|uniref:Uncharacterized protein n=1 Tax=Thamnocephalis sphaerospora TaxID=78915 RepID=A0A4P9XRF3_9FUNG|nr:hypothetical protein THASP1DRAFT_23388 [Thamnocephalis sphaerospora]|eukprot:RKP08663.1 hypothetical protein THASP1DRAFT_23388 [Thamnocephalis sphaerospora]
MSAKPKNRRLVKYMDWIVEPDADPAGALDKSALQAMHGAPSGRPGEQAGPAMPQMQRRSPPLSSPALAGPMRTKASVMPQGARRVLQFGGLPMTASSPAVAMPAVRRSTTARLTKTARRTATSVIPTPPRETMSPSAVEKPDLANEFDAVPADGASETPMVGTPVEAGAVMAQADAIVNGAPMEAPTCSGEAPTSTAATAAIVASGPPAQAAVQPDVSVLPAAMHQLPLAPPPPPPPFAEVPYMTMVPDVHGGVYWMPAGAVAPRMAHSGPPLGVYYVPGPPPPNVSTAGSSAAVSVEASAPSSVGSPATTGPLPYYSAPAPFPPVPASLAPVPATEATAPVAAVTTTSAPETAGVEVTASSEWRPPSPPSGSAGYALVGALGPPPPPPPMQQQQQPAMAGPPPPQPPVMPPQVCPYPAPYQMIPPPPAMSAGGPMPAGYWVDPVTGALIPADGLPPPPPMQPFPHDGNMPPPPPHALPYPYQPCYPYAYAYAGPPPMAHALPLDTPPATTPVFQSRLKASAPEFIPGRAFGHTAASHTSSTKAPKASAIIPSTPGSETECVLAEPTAEVLAPAAHALK